MTSLKNLAAIALLMACCVTASAQKTAPPFNEPDYNKPKLFSDLPDGLRLRITDMQSLLDLPVGADVKTTIANGFVLNGTVVSKSNSLDTTVKSVVIKTNNRGGSTFTYTRITNNNGSFSYSGRIMSRESSDALEIVSTNNGYVFRKRGLYDLINE